MKKIKFLAMALAALTMASCSKEEVGSDTVQKGKARVTVKITGQEDQVKSRAAGPSNETTEVVVSNFTIYLFNDGGGLIGTPAYVTGSNEGTVGDATTAAKNIYIVANTGPIDEGYFVGVTSLADLKTRVGELIKDNVATQTKTNLWMAGTGVVGKFEAGAGKDDPSIATGTVELGFLAAKIDVVIKEGRTNNVEEAGKISIKDDLVALLFAGAEGKFFETEAEQAVQTSFFSGITNYPDPATSTQADVLADTIKTPFTANVPEAAEYHFYTFGNDATTMPTILTIKSTRTNADGTPPTPIYYPIHFSGTDAGETIVPGKQYLVTLTLKGDVGQGGGGGTTDPEEELKSADVTVTVTPAEWKAVVKIGKEFN